MPDSSITKIPPHRIKAGVVGIGHMGQYHVNVYAAEIFHADLVGIADVDADKVRKVAHKYETVGYSDHRQLLDKVDIVSIAVPTSLHYPVAKDFLEAGVNVLIEKPMTHTMEEARDLFAIAKKNDVVLHIGHVERFNGAVQELKNIVEDPILIECRRLSPFTPRIQDDGAVMDIMIHDLDIVLNLVDSQVKTIHAVGSSLFTDKEDLANVQIVFESGCVANISASRATQNKIRTLAISQKNAYIFLDYTDQDIHIHRQASSFTSLNQKEIRYRQESFIERLFIHRGNPLKLELQHFIDCAVNGADRVVAVEDELRSLEVALQVVKQLRAQGVGTAAIGKR